MNMVLLTGRGGSKSIPGKNVYPVLGRPLAYYPMMAALQSRLANAVFVSTNDPAIKSIAEDLGIEIIHRPDDLSRDDSELTDAILHALETVDLSPEVLVTMHCNCAVHRTGLVDECIERLLSSPDADSCVTGHIDRSVHPFRTKRVQPDGFLGTWMEVSKGTSTNRQALDGCFILDGACRAMRVSRCFPPEGQPPFTYLGNRILPLENISGGDVHGMEDIVLAEHLLREQGWRDGAEKAGADHAP
jgi:N-acylneuraminate cytidylyltransferase